jgi:hypothetical protein
MNTILVILIVAQTLTAAIHPIEKPIDDYFAMVVNFGDPDHLFPEEPAMLKEMCKKQASASLPKEIKEYLDNTKGVLHSLAETILANFDLKIMCKHVTDDKMDFAVKALKSMNQKVKDLQKVRLGFVTAMTNILKDDKAKFGDVMCYLKEYAMKSEAIIAQDKEAAQVMQGNFGEMVTKSLAAVEKEKGKASEGCSLPEASTNPSEYKSVIVPFMKAIEKFSK